MAYKDPSKQREASRRWRLKHRERVLAEKKVYRKKNPAKAREAVRKWYLKNREKVLAKKRLAYFENPDKEIQRHRKWQIENKEKVNLLAKKWRQKNQTKYLEAQYRSRRRRFAAAFEAETCALANAANIITQEVKQ